MYGNQRLAGIWVSVNKPLIVSFFLFPLSPVAGMKMSSQDSTHTTDRQPQPTTKKGKAKRGGEERRGEERRSRRYTNKTQGVQQDYEQAGEQVTPRMDVCRNAAHLRICQSGLSPSPPPSHQSSCIPTDAAPARKHDIHSPSTRPPSRLLRRAQRGRIVSLWSERQPIASSPQTGEAICSVSVETGWGSPWGRFRGKLWIVNVGTAYKFSYKTTTNRDYCIPSTRQLFICFVSSLLTS